MSVPEQRARLRLMGAAAAAALAAVLPCLALAQQSFVEYFRAVKIDDARKVASLLAQGFDPNAIEEQRGESGLMLAVREDAMSVFQTLLDTPGTDINARAFNGDTALMIACFKGNQAAAEALLGRGAMVHHDGWSPVHYAAASGHNGLVRLLLELGAPLDARSANNTTPMMMAAWGGHIMTVKLLLDDGADATLKNDHGMTAIDFADRGGYREIVEGLTWRLKRAGKL